MKNLTTPQAILFGLGLIALAIVISSESSNIMIKEAKADYVLSGHLSQIASHLGTSNELFGKALYEINETLKKCN